MFRQETSGPAFTKEVTVMTDNSIITTTNVINSSGGVSIPQKITKRDVAVFGTLLMKSRSLDVGRRMQKGVKVMTDPEVRAITAFCL